MTTPQQLEEQIQREDIEPYLNKVYDGFVPDTFVDQFRSAMMFLPVTAHKYSMRDIETMMHRRHDEVTNRELGMMLNVIFAIPFASMYGSLEEGVEKTKAFEKLKEDYNKSTAAFQRKCDAKMARLLKLSGINNSTSMNGNGMKIIQ